MPACPGVELGTSRTQSENRACHALDQQASPVWVCFLISDMHVFEPREMTFTRFKFQSLLAGPLSFEAAFKSCIAVFSPFSNLDHSSKTLYCKLR